MTKPCKRCGGVGQMQTGRRALLCPQCEGSGVDPEPPVSPAPDFAETLAMEWWANHTGREAIEGAIRAALKRAAEAAELGGDRNEIAERIRALGAAS